MDEELLAQDPEHEPVPADAADQVVRRAEAGVQPGRMPAIYLGHGAPPSATRSELGEQPAGTGHRCPGRHAPCT
jgi:hypothetical protein